MSHWSDSLPSDTCREALNWCLTQPDYATAWDACPRGDWLLWLAGRVGVDRRLVVLAACDCARLALVHVPAGEERPRRAIETAERWARGEATLDDVRAAARAASAASAAAYAASAAAYAAYAAAYAADYAADADEAAARAATLARCADLVRARIDRPDLGGAL